MNKYIKKKVQTPLSKVSHPSSWILKHYIRWMLTTHSLLTACCGLCLPYTTLLFIHTIYTQPNTKVCSLPFTALTSACRHHPMQIRSRLTMLVVNAFMDPVKNLKMDELIAVVHFINTGHVLQVNAGSM